MMGRRKARLAKRIRGLVSHFRSSTGNLNRLEGLLSVHGEIKTLYASGLLIDKK